MLGSFNESGNPGILTRGKGSPGSDGSDKDREGTGTPGSDSESETPGIFTLGKGSPGSDGSDSESAGTGIPGSLNEQLLIRGSRSRGA